MYQHEKVYEIRANHNPGFPRTNMKLNKVAEVPIHDVRHEECSLATNGFFLMKLDPRMSLDDFKDTSKIEARFLPTIARAVKVSVNAQRVQIFDYAVCATDNIKSIGSCNLTASI